LRFLVGIQGTEVDVRGTLEEAAEAIPGYEQALADALTRRPELAQLARSISISDELATLYAANTKPRLDLQAAAGWGDLDTGAKSGSGENWSAALVFSFPFCDGGQARGQVAQARSQAASLKLDEQLLRDTIALQVRQALDVIRETSEIVASMGGVVAEAERLLAMAEKGFEYGVKTRLEVEDADLNLSEARLNLAAARRNRAVAQVTLRWVTGRL
jgi:HAE1 family hydrophobic/amphiphilic exporter-1